MDTKKDSEQTKIIDIIKYKQKKSEKIGKYSLRKIATIGLTSVGLLAAIATLPKLNDRKELTDITGIELDLEENEIAVVSQLELYSTALQEYEEIMSQKKHSELEEIEKRMNLIEQTRGLIPIADYLMAEKVKEAFELTSTDAKAFVQRVPDTKTPTDFISIESTEKELKYTSLNLPKEFTIILNHEEAIKVYEGSGENSAWNKEMNSFINEGNGLYNTIVKVLEKDFHLEDNNIKAKTKEKQI